jgi:hypothetical protein
MRISLLAADIVYPLAGEAAVDERTHSSAGDLVINAAALVQTMERVRASHAKAKDRGNLRTTISFSTSRKFATPDEASLAALDHDSEHPREGILILEVTAPGGAVSTRHLLDAVVSPPQRRCIGCTVLYAYQVTGGEIIAADEPTSMWITGELTDGSDPVIFPEMLYVGLVNGRPYYSDTGEDDSFVTLLWDDAWLLNFDGSSNMWLSTEDVARPDLVTTWTPGGDATGTPVVTGALVVAGFTDPLGANGTYLPAGLENDRPRFVKGIYEVSYGGIEWAIFETGEIIPLRVAGDPDDLTPPASGWTLGSGTGTVTTAPPAP